ncbi:MAG TPA: D-alanine--D-alanine ligase [Candidatus Eisenbacteria bacterium]|nr:D-alanine--D-alanine ligase [Candidatus Eisenbacteria bacterium]
MKVVVLMGGDTPEREVSLRSGAGISKALAELGHEVTLLDTGTGRILPNPETALELGSKPPAPLAVGAGGPAKTGATHPREDDESSRLPVPGAGAGNLDVYAKTIPRGADLVFIALHGGDGENGVLQAVLDLARIPYTGSGVLASAVSMDKSLSKRIFRDLGIPTPDWIELEAPAESGARWRPAIGDAEIETLGGYPVIVKPNDQGSSVGISVVRTKAELLPAIEDARRYGRLILVESFIEGREVTVAVLEGRSFPVVEIEPEGGWYDYRHKYTAGASRYEVPAKLPPEITERILSLGRDACRALRVTGLARVDFRLSEDGTPYCLEVNTVPGMTETSLVPKAAAAAGLSYKELVRSIVESAPARARSSTRIS